jgi:hypothetical protein
VREAEREAERETRTLLHGGADGGVEVHAVVQDLVQLQLSDGGAHGALRVLLHLQEWSEEWCGVMSDE